MHSIQIMVEAPAKVLRAHRDTEMGFHSIFPATLKEDWRIAASVTALLGHIEAPKSDKQKAH